MPRSTPLARASLGSIVAWVAVAGCHPGEEPEALDDAETAQAEGPQGWRSLAHMDRWEPESADDDPLPEHRPDHVECEGWYPEAGGLEVDTGACSYLSLQQPLLTAIEPGDSLRVQLWWQTLASVEPATGHLALLVDGELLWEELVPIPGPAAARSLEFPSPLGAPAGAALTFHLHNHGYNTWHLHELSVLGSEP